jgi:hypothetical protein
VTLHRYSFLSYNQYFRHGKLQTIVLNRNLLEVWISVFPRSKKKLRNCTQTHTHTHSLTHTHIFYASNKLRNKQQTGKCANKINGEFAMLRGKKSFLLR